MKYHGIRKLEQSLKSTRNLEKERINAGHRAHTLKSNLINHFVCYVQGKTSLAEGNFIFFSFFKLWVPLIYPKSKLFHELERKKFWSMCTQTTKHPDINHGLVLVPQLSRLLS